MSKQSLHNMHSFSVRHITAFLCIALCLKAILVAKSSTENTKIWRTCYWMKKRTLVYSITKIKSVFFFFSLMGNIPFRWFKFSTAFFSWMTAKYCIDSGITVIFVNRQVAYMDERRWSNITTDFVGLIYSFLCFIKDLNLPSVFWK